MLTSEVLNRAADSIQSNGWWSGTQGGRGWCASNAISVVGACRDAELSRPAQRALWTYLGGTAIGDIFSWNDAPGRTASEVIEVLRAAAAIEQAREAALIGVSA